MAPVHQSHDRSRRPHQGGAGQAWARPAPPLGYAVNASQRLPTLALLPPPACAVSASAPQSMLSLPDPVPIWSAPAPVETELLPLPAVTVSTPAPEEILSLPEPVMTTLAPAPAATVLLPLPASIQSSPSAT